MKTGTSFQARKGSRSRAGRTQAEVMAVFVLLLLLGLSIFSLATAGSGAYKRTNAARSAQSEVRVAMSFLQMKVRQTDASESVRIDQNPVNGQNSLVLSETFSGRRYDTWVYHDSGLLREVLVEAGQTFDNAMAFPIADLEGFEVRSNPTGSGLIFRAWSRDGRDRTIQSQVSMAVRSGGVR